MKPDEYEKYTPHELNLMIQDYMEKQKADMETKTHLAIITAYYSATFQREKKLRPLKNILKKLSTKKQKQQSPEEIFEVVKSMNAALGGEEIGNTT